MRLTTQAGCDSSSQGYECDLLSNQYENDDIELSMLTVVQVNDLQVVRLLGRVHIVLHHLTEQDLFRVERTCCWCAIAGR